MAYWGPRQQGYLAPTHTSLCRTRKNYAQIVDTLRKNVKLLQKDAEHELSLEYESQRTFEFLLAQVRALRNAFGTLSEVAMDEIESSRTDSRQDWDEFRALADAQSAQITQLRTEMADLRQDNVRLRHELDDATAAMRKATGQSAQDLERLRSAVVDDVERLCIDVAGAKAAAAEAAGRVAAVDAAQTAAARDVDRRFAEASKRSEARKRNIGVLTEQLVQVEAEGAEMMKRLRDVEDTLRDLDATTAETRVKATGASSQQLQVTRDIQTLFHEVSALRDQTRDTAAGVAASQADAAAKLEQRASATAKQAVSKAESAREAMERRASGLESALALVQDQVRRVRGDIDHKAQAGQQDQRAAAAAIAAMQARLVAMEQEAQRRQEGIRHALHSLSQQLKIAMPMLP